MFMFFVRHHTANRYSVSVLNKQRRGHVVVALESELFTGLPDVSVSGNFVRF